MKQTEKKTETPKTKKGIGMSKRGKVEGVGFCSDEDLKSTGADKKTTKPYRVWTSMLKRTNDKKFKKKFPAYKDATVCEEWHDYANFHAWYEENFYEVPNEKSVELDKDIIVAGNKHYSPETCAFVPRSINLLLNSNSAQRGDCPQGVHLHHTTNKYLAKHKRDGRTIHLGLFEDPQEAYEAYKTAKEAEVKRKANEYRKVLPTPVYEALMAWKLED